MDNHRENKIEEILRKAWNLRGQGNYNESRLMLEEAEKLVHKDEYAFLARISHIHSQYARDHNELQRSLKLELQTIQLYHKAKQKKRIAHAQRHVADIYRELKEFAMANDYYQRALNIYQELELVHSPDYANCLRGIALLHQETNQSKRALEYWKSILLVYQEHNFKEGVQEAQNSIHFIENQE